MKNVIENYRSDYGLLSSGNLPYLKYTCKDEKQIVDDNLYPPYNSDPDTLNNMSFGTGAIANIRQDIGHSIRNGFGRENGSFFPRSVRRRFNIEFQRGGYNKCKFGCSSPCDGGCGAYAYESDLPVSYYPRTYLNTYPYSRNLDKYPYHDDGLTNLTNNTSFQNAMGPELSIQMGSEMGDPDMGQIDMSSINMGMKNIFGEGMVGDISTKPTNDINNNVNWIIIVILLFIGYFLFFKANN